MEAEREPLLRGAAPAVPAACTWRKLSPRRVAVGLTLALALLSVTVLAALHWRTPTEQQRLRSLEAEIDTLRRKWGVHGVSVAIVRRDKVLLARGFGEKNEKGDQVTADTIFGIGSTTKAFTSLLIGQLVEQGKVSWTTPVTSLHLSSFKDPIAASQANLIDILSHQTGLPRHDAMFGFWNTTKDCLARLNYLEPTESFRSTWQYNNWMYELAGDIVRDVSGKASWADALKGGILDPLNMTSTIGSFWDTPYTPDHARSFDEEGNLMPYEADGGSLPPTSAGAMSSSANDAGQWLRALLGRGSLSGTQLVNETTFQQLTQPHKTMDSPRTKEYGYTSYGLAWIISEYRGHHSVSHTGSTSGFKTALRFFPDDDLAYIIMTNTIARSLSTVLDEVISERLLFPEIPQSLKWSDVERETLRAAAETERLAVEKRRLSRLNGTSPSHPLDDYVGTYTHPAYGRFKITRPTPTSDILHGRVINPGSVIAINLTHWHLDVFAITGDTADVVFETEASTGAIDALVIPLEPSVVAGERFVKEA
ncbi:beta-lactamase/transpeptidase-like protein [Blyttiomyces helicus]|uniref:Beta-lactamase/transpeptidase-like protein n=1 Tax=Blyttiomyces helicus TaxID=388810 RepID=A0A4P9W9X3_9FUNG|nr:beta-lactamase/transpeptidase-like protein [Blyttiomyces helicus]|eukprot:RKO88325.1 beta-lactamase/transpeptidase-like protein [Blyttiomyces helicus]